MKGELIKISENTYRLEVNNSPFYYGHTSSEFCDLPNKDGSYTHKLSLKNCQAIERGYDLDELAEKEFPLDYDIPLFETLSITEKSHKSILIGMLQGTLQKGFQKALELLSDKKFSEEDVISMIEKSRETGLTAQFLILTKQQTEWDVWVVMACGLPDGCTEPEVECTCDIIPCLDADGCVILKRL